MIREATPADREAICALVADTLAEFGFPVESNGVDADLDDLPVGYQTRGGTFRVLVDDADAVVGCGGLYPMMPGVAELRKMYFRPSIRGRGFGKRLIQDLIDRARRLQFHRIELETASTLVAAIVVYEQAGFVETDGPKHSRRCDRTFALELS